MAKIQGVNSTNYANKPVSIQKQVEVGAQYAGQVMIYQRAEVPPGGDCETVGDWTEELSGSFDITAFGSGKIGSNSIKLAQTVAAGNRSVYDLFAAPMDLRWARYVGFWYQGGDNDIFAAGDIKLYITTDPAKVIYADASMYINTDAFTEEATAVWHYTELAIADFTVNDNEGLRNVWAIGFYSDAGTNGNVLVVDQIEFYAYGTGYGPARGSIKAAPIADGVTVAKGDGLAWTMNGRVKIAIDNEPEFAGIAIQAGSAVGAERGVGIAYFVEDGPVQMLCNDGSIADQEGVSLSAAGAAASITIDDGGAVSTGFMIGKAMEAGIANEVIVVILKDKNGTTA